MTSQPVAGLCFSGVATLFEKLQRLNVNLVSMRDGIDLSTAAGRLTANVLASITAYENEIRGERVRAGEAAARAAGKRWGGSKKGRRIKVTDEQVQTIRRMHDDGTTRSATCRATGLSRPSNLTGCWPSNPESPGSMPPHLAQWALNTARIGSPSSAVTLSPCSI